MLIIGLGLAGAVGATLRYALGLVIPSSFIPGPFPLATLLINYLGCLSLAWLIHSRAVKSRLSETLRITLGSGLIGAFTTFSAFSVETITLLHDEHVGMAALYVLLSAAGGFGLAWCGERLAAFSPDPGTGAADGRGERP